MQRLREASEKAKIELSSSLQVSMAVVISAVVCVAVILKRNKRDKPYKLSIYFWEIIGAFPTSVKTLILAFA